MTDKREKSEAAAADPLDGYPTRLRHSTENPGVVYVRASGLFALRGSVSPASRSAADAPLLSLQTDGGDKISIYRGAPAPGTTRARAMDGPRAIAVYELGRSASAKTPARAGRGANSSGGLAVPTGRVFVRFGDAIKAESRADELQKLGYRIAQTLAYAPNAAWLESIDGDQAALRNIDAIEKLAGVVNVEPQLLTQRATR